MYIYVWSWFMLLYTESIEAFYKYRLGKPWNMNQASKVNMLFAE